MAQAYPKCPVGPAINKNHNGGGSQGTGLYLLSQNAYYAYSCTNCVTAINAKMDAQAAERPEVKVEHVTTVRPLPWPPTPSADVAVE